ncbi:unnamed protein product [Ambrosiozyma monospora]|uniref:Unnamed protein product n=1 Tax=Ambrosiozyma monospora TaxID=43982 RepID=A0A9W7DGJ4_AMBMO|nr:unnamed protein product [Ambrosiozyma monospora]
MLYYLVKENEKFQVPDITRLLSRIKLFIIDKMPFKDARLEYGSISSDSSAGSASSSYLNNSSNQKRTGVEVELHELTPTPTTAFVKVLSFLWDGHDKSPKEKSFLIKLDWFLLSSAMLGYFIKSLNQSNISTAYMNGMKSYYGMNHNEYNYMVSFWTIGYICGAIPANYLLHKVNARVYLGVMEILWGILTLSMITCGPDQIVHVYFIRFIVGLLEAAFFPTVSYIIGSWYSAGEMTKRTSLFYVSSCLAGIISGPLQEWLLQKFHRNNGVDMGWGGGEPFKCMFVVDAIISCPIGLYTLLVNPNTPTTTDAWYFSDQDKLVALERYNRMQREASERGDINGSSRSAKSSGYRDLFKSWHIFVFPLMFLCFHHSGWAIGQPTFQTWMKYDLKLPSSKYNFYPASHISPVLGFKY